MRECDQAIRLNAYHDGELLPEALAEVEAHLRSCPACAAALADMQRLSRTLAAAQTPALTPAARARLHGAVDSLAGRGVLRLAEALAGIAAALLIACSVGLAWQGSAQATPAPMPVWEVRAVDKNADTPTTAPDDLLAAWMVDDLSGKDGR